MVLHLQCTAPPPSLTARAARTCLWAAVQGCALSAGGPAAGAEGGEEHPGEPQGAAGREHGPQCEPGSVGQPGHCAEVRLAPSCLISLWPRQEDATDT